MKLASIAPLSDNFVSENLEEDEEKIEETGVYTRQDEEEINEEEDDMGAPEEAPVDMGAPEEEEPLDMDEPMDEDPDSGAADMALTEEEAQLLIDLGKRLEGVVGVESAEDDMDMEMDMEAPAEEEPALEDEEEPAPLEEEEDLEETNSDDLVNEVLRRVTKRIMKERISK